MDEREFLELVSPNLRRLLRLARRMCRDADLADDLVQETVMQALRTRDQLRATGRLLPWMFAILRRIYLRRSSGEERRLELLTSAAEFAGEPIGDLEQEILRASFSDELDAAIRRLPEELATALLLADVEGFSYDEIAEVMQAPAGTIASRIARARARLLRELTDHAKGRSGARRQS